MDGQSGLLNAVFDPAMALAVAAVVFLVGLIVRERQEAKRKRSDPKVICLSACLGVYRPNQRAARHTQSTA
jgi:hypothetical protein